MYPVSPLGSDTSTWATALSNEGAMVGNSTTSLQNSWLSIWQSSPGADHAIFYSWTGGTVLLQTLNGNAGLPLSINDWNQIVGESHTAQGAIHGFITMPGGAAYDLNSLIPQGSGYTILAGTQINDQGQISAIAQGPKGLDYFLYLTPNVPIDTLFAGTNGPPTTPPSNGNPISPPVPEPGPIFLLGLVAVCGAVKRLRARLRN